MSQVTDFDIGPLSWVKAELDAALGRATASLDEALAQPGQREPLRFAQNHVHQASGALAVVGLDGVAQFSEAIDKLLSALAGAEDAPSSEQLQLAKRSLAVLANYLSELIAGAEHKPLRLFPAYRELVIARGEDAPQASELFFPDISVRPQLDARETVTSANPAHDLRVLRGRFEKGLLQWLRQPHSRAGAEEMLRAVQGIERIQSQPATRAFWWASIAFFEGLAEGVIAVERSTQRLCRRIDTQMRRIIEGSQVVAERLVRDVLYFVATANVSTPHAQSVREVYKLAAALPTPDQEISSTLRQPLILRAQEALEACKDAWNRFSAGAAIALPQFQDQLDELLKRVQALNMPLIEPLLGSMSRVGSWLRDDPLRQNEAVSMELATGLLIAEHAIQSPAYDKSLLQRQVDMLSTIYDIRSKGGRPPAMDASLFGDASTRAQERLFFNQLAREIQTNLGQIEQALDAFFRAPEQRDSLAALAAPLKQVEGALSMLGENRAAQLVGESAAQIRQFSIQNTPPEREACDSLAHNLSALGFYVEALRNGPARLDDFLDPSGRFAAEAAKDAASGTVEAQLLRESRETQSLVEALRDEPENSALREQLVSNLEAIRDDAHLLADRNLEQQASDVIADLKAGGSVSSSHIQEALSAVASPAAPQHSEEAERLMQVSVEELDAELLEIFLEEAQEVLANQSAQRAIAAREPHNHEALVTIRRGFHTLKGSSRMVGLEAFSEAARQVEMTMNRWLQLEKDTTIDLLSLIDAGVANFGAWVEQLKSGGSAWRDAKALIEHAQALLASLDPAPDEAYLPNTLTPTRPPHPERAVAEDPATAQSGASLADESLDPLSQAEGLLSLPELPESAPDSAAEHYDSSLEASHIHDMPHVGELGQDSELMLEPLSEFDLTATELEDLPGETSANGEEDALFTGTDLDLDLDPGVEPPPAAEEAPAEEELDLAASLLNDSLLQLQDEHDARPAETAALDELDLTATSLEDLLDEIPAETQPTTSLETEAESGSEAASEVEIELDSLLLPDTATPEEAQAETDLSSTALDDLLHIPETGPAHSIEALGEVPPAASVPDSAADHYPEPVLEPALEEVSIEDDDEDIGLPVINLESAAVPPSQHETEPEPFPESIPDSDVQIGGSTLSRGLYELYLNESAQHLASLRADQQQRLADPTLPPSKDAVRAAHTLGGISGTTRFEAPHLLGKALEHCLHRFNEAQVAPDAAQEAVIDAAIGALEVMRDEIAAQLMPYVMSDLASQLDSLQAHLPEPASDWLGLADGDLAEEALADEVVTEPAFTEPAFTEPALDATPEPQAEHDAALSELPATSAIEAEAALQAELGSAAQEDEILVSDELDEQLLPIFFEEADELSAEIGDALRQLRSDPLNEEPRNALARLMHTLKGSARMAGAMRLGEAVHRLESRLEAAGANSSDALIDELENGFDQVGNILRALRDPNAAVAASALPESSTDTLVTGDERIPEASPAAEAEAPNSVPAPRSDADIPAVLRAAPPADTPEAPATPRALVRVRADLVDRFVNEAGEISIARTRVEGEMRTLRRSLLDLTENVIRLRNQLREVEISAESQMQSRIAAAESQHANFDPLEFDRFTRLQELTRMMAESVGDVTTIQQTLLRNLDGADSALHAQGRLSRDLQQALMGVRMVPFNDVVDRLYRVVRQSAREMDKRANLDIIGGNIEIDRGVLDKMVAPIEHLLRNAIAHGIESPAERLAAGKPETGQITLKLSQLSNEIALEMADDGHGLDYQRIAARARSSGLLGADEEVSENRLTQMIFEPGFSTAEQVTGLAGRGIGMDVVKNEALSVGGRIDVSSTPGQGARFLIHLPLTLAVTQALLVRVGARTYAIPSNMVEQAIEVKEDVLNAYRSQGYAEWKGQRYPVRYLPRLLGDTESQPETKRFHWVLLLRAGNDQLGLYIDALLGNQEIIVKNAGPQFVRLHGYTGATVLPNGEISLILNPVVLAGRQGGSTLDSDLQSQQASEVSTAYTPIIMVVDDSLTVRKITSRLLEREGYKVITAKDGVDALEQLTETLPDVMLLDIEMPRMDGFDLARNIRGDARLRHLPLIMITSRMADKHRNYAMEIGVNHYLGKPYQEDQLLGLIDEFVTAAHRR
ncbi:Hpt domain-containing protein [Uliginosibacterium sediminicola]|uniref:histidine kinase n=1 Tax=Uliginosibacterium sediminicola TaxID=2024550 RepID=A0ABU9YXQ7_9RHOO